MSVDWLAWLDVLLYGLVASQHAFYAAGFESAQRALGAPAYVELRNALDVVLRKRLPALYVSTLLVTVLALLFGDAPAATAVALAALLADAWLMLAKSAPINALFQTWTTERMPDDWQSQREAWLAIFHRRQIAVAVGFLTLLAGAVAR